MKFGKAGSSLNTKKTLKNTTKKNNKIFDEKDLDKKLYCDSKVLAKIFGVTVRRIQQYTQDGIIETIDTEFGKRYEMIPTISHFVKYQSDKLKNRGASKKEEDLKMQKLEAEIELKKSQGELHRLKTDIAQGKYIDVDIIQEDYNKFFSVFKKFALSLPGKVALKLNGYIEPIQIRGIEKETKEEVVKQLNGFIVAATVDHGD